MKQENPYKSEENSKKQYKRKNNQFMKIIQAVKQEIINLNHL